MANPSELSLPDPETWSVKGVVAAYDGWLEVKAPGHRKAFLRRLKDDPEAAHAEAVTFNLLRMMQKNPHPGEVVGEGGVDFICTPKGHQEFAVEVTVLQSEAVTAASGLTSPLQNGAARGFSQITTKLMQEAVNKAGQMSGYSMPRVLVIATEHEGASLLMGAHSAEELLTGTTAFRVRIGDTEASPDVITTLKNSVFFREKNGSIEPARQSISAILLMQIREDGASVIGVMHPAAAIPLDPYTFERVHFVRLRHWPIKDRFGIEWVGPPPSPTSFPHVPMGLADSDVRA
jgi:hypothetical protein